MNYVCVYVCTYNLRGENAYYIINSFCTLHYSFTPFVFVERNHSLLAKWPTMHVCIQLKSVISGERLQTGRDSSPLTIPYTFHSSSLISLPSSCIYFYCSFLSPTTDLIAHFKTTCLMSKSCLMMNSFLSRINFGY